MMKNNRQSLVLKVACAVIVFIMLSACGRVDTQAQNADMLFLSNINDGIQSTNFVLSNQINIKYTAFEDQYYQEPEKAGSFWEQAQALRREATDALNYIETLKWDLVKKTENENARGALVEGLLKSVDTLRNGRENYDINISKMKSGSRKVLEKGTVSELVFKIGHFRDEVIKVMGSERVNKEGLDIDGNWVNDVFDKMTLAEKVVALNNLIMEVQSVELSAVTELQSSIHARDFTFDEIGAMVFAESNYLLSGQTYHAQAFVTSWQNFQTTAYVRLDGGPEKEFSSDSRGVINLDFNCDVGRHNYMGIIKMLDPRTNEIKEFPFVNSFTVVPSK